MANLHLAYSGNIKFKPAPFTSQKEFYNKTGFSCNSNDVPYMYVPHDIMGKSEKDILGMLGLIINTTEGVSQYFIVAGINDNSRYDIISNNLMYGMKYSEEENLWYSDSSDEYTVLLCIDNIKWDKDKPIKQQLIDRGNIEFGYYEIVKSSSNVSMFDQENIDTSKIYPYIVSIDRRIGTINYSNLVDFGVVGVIIEAGYLYDKRHLKLDRYANPKLSEQIKEVTKSNLPYGFYAITRAKTVEESNLELEKLVTLLRTYSSALGIWIEPDFQSKQTKTVNDKIINNYKKILTSDRVGFQDSIGIYANEQQLSSISWNEHCDDWYLWLDKPIGDIQEIQKLLTPETFEVGD